MFALKLLRTRIIITLLFVASVLILAASLSPTRTVEAKSDYDSVNKYTLSYDSSSKEYKTTVYLEPDKTGQNACRNSTSVNVNNFNVTVSGNAIASKSIDIGCEIGSIEGLGAEDNTAKVTVDVTTPSTAQNKGSIKVRLVKPDGQPIDQGYQIVYAPSGFVTRAYISDPTKIEADGTVVISGLSPGSNYALTNWSEQYDSDGAKSAFCVPGTSVCYRFAEKNIKVSANKQTTVNITLTAIGSDDEDEDSCESIGGLAWIICPVVKVMDNGIEWLDSFIQGQLETPDPNNLGEDGTEQLKLAWGRMRNIALIILIPIMLVMVISTALGFSFIDAYTVKRAMPRFLLAVLFISVSWYITAFLINLTNVVGQGIYGLMTQPFGVGDKSLEDFVSVGTGAAVTYGGFAILGGLFLAAGSIGIIFSIAFTAFAALFIAFAVLTLRQLMIVALLLLAPLAILAWIFPGNDKMWKLWWGSFTKLLLMYPLIMILLAAGRIFASVIDISRGDSFVNQIIMILAFIIPYFFISATFKMAGGMFGALSGTISDRSRGLFDRQKKFRQGKSTQNWADYKAGNKSWRPRAVNNLGRRIDAGWKGRFGLGRHGEQFRDIQQRTNAAEALKNPKLQQLAYSDDGIAALALSGGTKDGARRRLAGMGWNEARIANAIAAADQVGFTRTNAAAGLEMMARNKSRALSGRFAGDPGMALVRDSAAEISGGDAHQTENLTGGFAFHSRGAGRLDLGGEGVGISAEQGWQRSMVGQHMQAFGESTGHYARSFVHDMQHGDLGQRRAAATALLEMHANKSGATEENQGHINAAMDALGIDPTATQVVTRTRNMTDSEGNLRRDDSNNVLTESWEESAPVSIAEQLARLAGMGDGGASVLQTDARTWGDATPIGARAPEEEATPPPPAGGAT